MLAPDPRPRPRDLSDRNDPAVLYAKSYLLIRVSVGVIGILLPIALMLGEWLLIRGGLEVRGSLSAYYHSSMRDLFVASLSVTGFLLMTYMAGERRTPDFWISLVAGLAVVGVAFFPTGRPALQPGAPLCGTVPEPAKCSSVQQALGEDLTAGIHFACAAIFILSLAVIAFRFASRDRSRYHEERFARVQKVCAWIILVLIVWVVLGSFLPLTIGAFTPLYVGEVGSVWAFGVSWLIASRDLTAGITGYTPPQT
jgi:hypothetical protein